MTRLLALSIAMLALAATGASAAQRAVHACTGAQLVATFKFVPNSPGAGNVVYRLTVKNVSKTTCTVTGLPKGTLLDKAGKAQPTHILNDGGNTVMLVIPLKPGASTLASARFSPDVPGVGEGNRKQCEPTSYWFRLNAPGGGTTKTKVAPPTPVCEHGQLQFTYYGHTLP